MDFHHVCNVTIVALESETKKYLFSFKSNNLIIILRQFNSPFLFSARLPISGGDDL